MTAAGATLTAKWEQRSSQAGVPTVGIDSLRYFWKRRPPETIAADLTRIIDHFSKTWKVRHVALIGYSFGADVLPAAYSRLAPAEKARVSLVSLLALSGWAEFQFDVGGWLGMNGDTSHPTLPDVARMPASILQCIYGADDDDSVCAKIAGGADIVMLDGGHHFDDDYAPLANRIIARIRERDPGKRLDVRPGRSRRDPTPCDNRKKRTAVATEAKPFAKPLRSLRRRP